MALQPIKRKPRGVSELLESIDLNLSRIERYLRPHGIPNQIKLFSIIEGQKKELRMLPLQLGEEALISIEILDAGGNPAKVQDDKLEWGLSVDTLGKLEVADGGMSAKFIRSGLVGSVEVFVKGDADLGDGVAEIVGKGLIECLSGQATVINMKLEVAPKA